VVIYLAAFTCGGYIAWILTTIVYQADEQNPRRMLVATEKELDQSQRRNRMYALEIDLLRKQLVSVYHDLDTCYKEIDILTQKLYTPDE
jgi:hypothetical protein